MADSIEQILSAVLTHAEQVIEGDCLYVALYNPVTVNLDFHLPPAERKAETRLEKPGAAKERWDSRPYQPDKLLPDYVLAQGKPELIEKAAEFEDWIIEKKLEYQDGELPCSWLAVPLLARGRAIGAVVVEHYAKEHAYDKRTQDVLSAIANRAAGALANARLVRNLRAVNEVGQRLTSEIRLSVKGILELIYQQARGLMDTRDMYIALYDEGIDTVSFGLARLDGKEVDVQTDEDWQPRKAGKGLTEHVIRTRELYCPEDVRAVYDKEGVVYVEPVPKSWLGVPMMIENRVLGVIAVQNDEVENLYGPDDQAVLQTMAGQAAVALANARLVTRLDAVNQVSQTLTSGTDLRIEGIWELIYDQSGRLMDTSNMYVALYDATDEKLGFPLATYQGVRVEWPDRKVEIEDETKGGLTEEVIRTKGPLRPPDVEAWYKERGIKPAVLPVPKSWLGVPMLSGNRVLGVIALQNDEVEKLYGPDDQAVLETMAGQAAIAAMAIENERLHSEILASERERLEAEKWTHLGKMAASLAHRIGNKGGMIRLCVNDLNSHLEYLRAEDELVRDNLDTIWRNNQYLLNLSEFLFKPVQATAEKLEKSDIVLYLEDALRYADVPEDVEVKVNYGNELPKVPGNKYFVEVFLELIGNAVEAMRSSAEKRLSINVERIGDWLEIRFSDTGRGIPEEGREVVFSLFSRASDRRLAQEGHRGFGLWWVKMFLTEIGGDIWCDSKTDRGTTFSIRLPLE